MGFRMIADTLLVFIYEDSNVAPSLQEKAAQLKRAQIGVSVRRLYSASIS